MPSGNYKQEVLQLQHYYYHDDNFEVNSARRDTIDVIKAWTPTFPLYTPYGGLFVIWTYTYTFPWFTNQNIETWAHADKPIKYWFENESIRPDFREPIVAGFNDITNKTNGKVTFQEVNTEPEHGIKIYYRNNLGGIAETYITQRDQNGMTEVAEEYFGLGVGPGIVSMTVACREHERALDLYAQSLDPTSVLAFPGIQITANGLNFEDAMVTKSIYATRLVILDMSKHDTTGVKNLINAISINDNPKVIDDYVLEQNYPKPFNPTTTIQFDLSKTSQATLKIFNILGEKVATLVSDRLSAGSYSYNWDVSHLASGVYLYRLETEGLVQTRKMILIR